MDDNHIHVWRGYFCHCGAERCKALVRTRHGYERCEHVGQMVIPQGRPFDGGNGSDWTFCAEHACLTGGLAFFDAETNKGVLE